MGVKKNINLLIIGIFIGILLAVSGAAALKYKDKIKAMAEKVDRKIENVRYLNTEKATEELILADFESADDFVKFQKSGVEASLTEDFHAHGASAVKLVFQPGEVASFKIEQFLKRDPSFFNWAAYGSFYFNIFNASVFFLKFQHIFICSANKNNFYVIIHHFSCLG